MEYIISPARSISVSLSFTSQYSCSLSLKLTPTESFFRIKITISVASSESKVVTSSMKPSGSFENSHQSHPEWHQPYVHYPIVYMMTHSFLLFYLCHNKWLCRTLPLFFFFIKAVICLFAFTASCND